MPSKEAVECSQCEKRINAGKQYYIIKKLILCIDCEWNNWADEMDKIEKEKQNGIHTQT